MKTTDKIDAARIDLLLGELRRHELRLCCKAAWEMRGGPSGSAFRSRSQTSPSCCGKESWWLASDQKSQT